MATRAHAIPSYPFERDVSRRRRPVVFQTNDPVVLPRGRSWDINSGLIAAAAAATLLVAGATYAVYYTEPSPLAETPSASLEREYVPDADFGRLNAMKALSGPQLAAPVAAPLESTSVAPPSSQSGAASMSRDDHEVIINDSAPGVQDSLPQPAGSAAPYPSPTIAPPEVMAPVEESPSPSMETENPYR